jgi:hypothetical protein
MDVLTHDIIVSEQDNKQQPNELLNISENSKQVVQFK